MTRDEASLLLSQLPSTADLVVRIGGILVEVLDLSYAADRDSIVLVLDADDVGDALTRWLRM